MLLALCMCPGCRNGTALFAAFWWRVFVWYRQFFRHNKGKTKQMTDENFVLCKETSWTKPSEYINPCLVNYEVTSLSIIVTQRRETSRSLAALLQHQLQDMSIALIAENLVEVMKSTLSLYPQGQPGTLIWSQSRLSHGDICRCSKPTCLISPLIYVVSDQVLRNSPRTWHSKCRCLPFKGLKPIQKPLWLFLPDSSPGGNYFQIPKLGIGIVG